MKTQKNEQLNLCRRHLQRNAEVWEDGEGIPIRGDSMHNGTEAWKGVGCSKTYDYLCGHETG